MCVIIIVGSQAVGIVAFTSVSVLIPNDVMMDVAISTATLLKKN